MLRAIRTLVADKRLSSRNRFSGASSFNPENFLYQAIANAENLPVKADRGIGVVNPELNLLTHFERTSGILEMNDAMFGIQRFECHTPDSLNGRQATQCTQGFDSGIDDNSCASVLLIMVVRRLNASWKSVQQH